MTMRITILNAEKERNKIIKSIKKHVDKLNKVIDVAEAFGMQVYIKLPSKNGNKKQPTISIGFCESTKAENEV